MVEIKKTIRLYRDKKVKKLPEGVTPIYFTKGYFIIRGEYINHDLEMLSCGHQNNLALEGRTSGKCPVGCV